MTCVLAGVFATMIWLTQTGIVVGFMGATAWAKRQEKSE